ncbi:unnamed protein product [Acanthosepion pharaonis]|uniref:Uncharacterized protein n=1 Tax=Acanthosepion pharaonis TaxID=158019 RepID=A0A812CEI3_ACAPH|nr:unnamed protein product [Sepia pharaonis]
MKDDILINRCQAKKEMEFYYNEIEKTKKHNDIWQEKVKTVQPEYKEVMGQLKTSEKKIEGIKTMEMKILFENSREKELEESEKEARKVLLFFMEIEENARKVWKASKERVEIEELEENTLRRLEEVRVERDNFEAATKKLITDLEAEYTEKLNMVKILQGEIKQTVDEIKRKVGDVRLMQDNHEDECIKKNALIKENEEKADEQERILNEISTKFESLSNPFKEMAFQYQECLQKYSSIYRRHSQQKYKLNELNKSKSIAEVELRILYKQKGIENYKLNIEETVQYNKNEKELQISLKELLFQLKNETILRKFRQAYPS